MIGQKLGETSNITPNDLPDGYRLTELGPLPEEWRVVKLGEVFRVIPKKERECIIEDGAVYRLLTVKLYAKGIVLRETKQGKDIGTKKLYRVQRGDFVFSKIDARNGAWGFVNDEMSGALVSGDFPILALNHGVADANFVMLFLSRPSSWEALRNLAVGTTNRRRIQPRELLSFLNIPLPPLPEQRAIAHVLRAVQEAKEATERVIAAARELKKSLMRHLFTYGPVPVDAADRVPMQETEIGPIPTHWRVVRLGEVVEVIRNGLTRRQNKEGKGLPVTRIETISEETIDISRLGYVESVTDQEFSRYRLIPGDILVSHINSEPQIGKSAIYEGHPHVLLHGMNLLLVRTKQSVCEPHFLNHLFREYRHKGMFIALAARAVGQASINQGKMKRLPIPLPPLSEQHQIARMLQAVDEKIRAEEGRKQALEALFKTLLHDLMTAKTRLPTDFIAQFEEVPHEPL